VTSYLNVLLYVYIVSVLTSSD